MMASSTSCETILPGPSKPIQLPPIPLPPLHHGLPVIRCRLRWLGQGDDHGWRFGWLRFRLLRPSHYYLRPPLPGPSPSPAPQPASPSWSPPALARPRLHSLPAAPCSAPPAPPLTFRRRAPPRRARLLHVLRISPPTGRSLGA